MKNKYLNKFFRPEAENQLSPRIKTFINWIIKNSSYFENSSFAKIIINIKGENIVGEINIFPDYKI
jgi:hypothetical protein